MSPRSPSRLVLFLLLAAACQEAKPPAAAPAPAADPASEALASYRVTASISPASVARGGKPALTLGIEVLRPDVHVQAEFPLKVTLTPSAGLSLARATLGHADAIDPTARDRRWEVAATTTAVGPQDVTAALRFAICKEAEPAWCVTRDETVRAAVEVR